jgi:hypothetical protein
MQYFSKNFLMHTFHIKYTLAWIADFIFLYAIFCEIARIYFAVTILFKYLNISLFWNSMRRFGNCASGWSVSRCVPTDSELQKSTKLGGCASNSTTETIHKTCRHNLCEPNWHQCVPTDTELQKSTKLGGCASNSTTETIQNTCRHNLCEPNWHWRM